MRPISQRTERYQCRCVGTALDGTAEKVLGIHGAPAGRLGGIRGGVFCLTVKILRRSCRLIEDALDLGFGVAGDPADAFLHFAAEISWRCAGAMLSPT